MLKRLAIAGSCLALLPAPLLAQDTTAPDGTPGFGFEPYVAIGGGYDVYDTTDEERIYGVDSTEGAIIIGTIGANVPLGAFFVGAEGFGAYGFNDIDWEYGVAGRFGVRVGDSGLFFGRVGYMWVEGENNPAGDFIDTDEGPSSRDRDGMIYGIGVEAGPRDIGLGGLTSNSGIRLRLGVDTFKNFESFRPNAAVVFHF